MGPDHLLLKSPTREARVSFNIEILNIILFRIHSDSRKSDFRVKNFLPKRAGDLVPLKIKQEDKIYSIKQ